MAAEFGFIIIIFLF